MSGGFDREAGPCGPPPEAHDGADGDKAYGPDLGDIIVVLLASSLAGLRDRLHYDGFHDSAELVADLVEAADDYLISRTDEPIGFGATRA